MLLFISLLAVGILPLVLFTSLNFPRVIVKLKQAGEERQLLALQQDFQELNTLMERRRESLQNLSQIPGVLDLATPSKSKVPFSIVKQRLYRFLIKWYNAKEDIVQISIIDSSGRERLNLSRDMDGNLKLDPQSEQHLHEHDHIFLERDHYSRPSITFSAGLHLHKSSPEGRKLPHTHLGVTIGRASRDSLGIAYMHLNLQNFLDDYPDCFLMRGDGAYIRRPEKNRINKKPEAGEAFKDFTNLKALLKSPRPAVLHHRALGNMAVLPLIINEHQEHNLWVGHKIGRKNITTWLKSYLAVFIGFLLVFIAIISVIANKISAKIDSLVRELTTGLTGLLESKTPVGFSWHGPHEIQELGQDLTRLAKTFLTNNQARENTEKELREVSRQQEMILRSAAEGIMGIHNEGHIIFANKRAEAIFGYREGELLHKNAHDTLHYRKADGSIHARKDCPFCQALSRRNPSLSTEDVYWLKDGSSIEVEYNSSPIYDEAGESQGAVLCFQDVSLRKEQEREVEKLEKQLMQSQKLEAIGTLAGGVAHDFNNILTVIMANTEILSLILNKEEEPYQHVEEIATAAGKAADLTRQLLSFSRQEKIKLRPLNLNELIQGIEKMVQRLIGEDIELEFNGTENLRYIEADPGQMEQVLMNLIVNARDAMPQGGKIVLSTSIVTTDETTGSVVPEARPGTFALLTVTDNGSGMTREQRDRIFDPFYSTKGIGKGTGLGLSVVFGIVQQHGGWINVYSEPGKGTTFKIYIPVSESAGETSRQDAEKEEEHLSLGNNEKVLLVEDEDQLRYVASALLSRDGYEVKEAASIKEALEIVEKEGDQLQLLISDVVLPDGYGPDLAEQLLVKYPDLPVIICSGYADDRSRRAHIKDKNFPFLQKPYTRHELLETVKAGLAGKAEKE